MTTQSATFEQKFRVDSNPAYCLMPHPNAQSGKTLPELLLERLGFTDLGTHDEKRIYLPACEKFPEATYILERPKGIALAGEQIVRRHGNKKPKAFEQPIDDFMRNFLLEQARARIEKKMLPSFRNVYSTYHGTENLRCTIVCESVSDGPKALNGSYVTIQPWNRERGLERQVQNCLQAIFKGAHKSKMPTRALTWSLEVLLEKAHPNFLWHLNYTRTLVGIND